VSEVSTVGEDSVCLTREEFLARIILAKGIPGWKGWLDFGVYITCYAFIAGL
jgi:hypothetical protein